MNFVVITDSAKENLFEIFCYHNEYSPSYAEKFQYEIDIFVYDTLSKFPKIGHIHNITLGIYRLVYKKRYNIYYQISGANISVIYILDAKIDMNESLKLGDFL